MFCVFLSSVKKNAAYHILEKSSALFLGQQDTVDLMRYRISSLCWSLGAEYCGPFAQTLPRLNILFTISRINSQMLLGKMDVHYAVNNITHDANFIH